MAIARSKRSREKVAKPRDVVINIRSTEDTRSLIDRAAALSGKTRTDFVLDSARIRAESMLLDQRLFVVDDERYAALLALLDQPAMPTERLRQLFGGSSPWEK